MGIRETLNKKPGVAAGVGGVLLVLGLTFLAFQFTGGASGPQGEAFFTIDDGATWFTDDAAKLAPFTQDGKEAVRAYVFKCADGKPYVNHLERHTPESKKMVEAAAEAERTGKPPPRAQAGAASMWGLEVKKPGEKLWTPASNLLKSGPMMNAKCPDKTEAELVVP